jgi:two-component system CheB/CheR fusion protein
LPKAIKKVAKKSPRTTQKRNVPKAGLVVGLGAAAGGINALKIFFNHLQKSADTAYVVVPHADGTGLALTQDLLQSFTALPVVEIKPGLALQAGKVYLTPPRALLDLKDGVFAVEYAESREQAMTLVDVFFKSLAEDFTVKAVGILLSGEGPDGTQGLKAISEHGGMTLVQDPATAEHPAMPQGAVATGIVDHVLKIAEMPARLKSYEHYVAQMVNGEGMHSLRDQIGMSLNLICEILHKVTHHDFKHYKTTTLIRRIQRRMQVLQLGSADAYIQKLQDHAGEIEALFKELLINVTCFFRDPEAFEHLREQVIAPALRECPPERKFRVWVAGCSSGEEAYTMAILIREEIERGNLRIETQIIATDIDDAALAQARKGSYPLSVAENISPERLGKFFQKRGGRYHISKEIREMVLFSAHNLINDPPFSQLDLISCRNVLIYLGLHLQKKLIPVFHYALKPGGYLFLGNSESLSTHKELFKSISAKHRLAQRKATAIRPGATFPSVISQTFNSQLQETQRAHEADVHLVSQRIVLDEFAPRYAVVNDDFQIISVSSGISAYLEPSEGSFQNHLVKLVRPSLRLSLRMALNEGQKHKRKIDTESATLKFEDGLRRVGITVQPMPQLGDDSGLFMVVFHKLGKIEGEIKTNVTEAEAQGDNIALVDQLERELSLLREDLDKTVQDLEASNEELKSSNEELLSMNEELQSANEELESSKEEVQAANEALQRGHTDLENLLSSTDIATVFLDESLQIQSFTPALEGVYNVTRTDLGRPISHFTNIAKLMPEYPTLDEILEGGGLIENEVEMRDGRWLLRRISPYKNTDGRHTGIVATFIDVTHIRAMEGQRRENEHRLNLMFETSPSFMCVYYGPQFIFEQVNPQTYKLVGHREILGQPLLEALPEVAGQGLVELLTQVRETGKEFIAKEMPVRLQQGADGPIELRYLDYVYQPDQPVNGEIQRIFVHGNDVTEKVRARQAVESSKAAIENERANFRNLFKQTPEMVCILYGPEHTFEFVNEAHVRVLGFDATGMTVRKAQPESIEVHGILDDVYRTGVTAELNEISITLGEHLRYFNLTYAARHDDAGKVIGVMILGTEVTDQVQARQDLKLAKDESEIARAAAEAASESKTRFLANMSHEIRTPLAAILGFSDLLQATLQDIDDEALDYLNRVSRNATHLGRLIDELLDLSKIEADKLDIERLEFDLMAAIEDSMSSVAHKAAEKGLVFQKSAGGEVPQFLISDPTRFRQILTNVIGNAVKFTDEGHVQIFLEQKKTGDQSFLLVRVSDTGIGLTPEQRQNLFQRFVQADNSVTRKYGGTGLGLVLSKKLAQLMGGDLEVDSSELGRGSSFLLTLPITTSEEWTLLRGQKNPESLPQVHQPLKDKLILIVDDAPDNQTIIRIFITKAGGQVEIANNGLEAVEKMKQKTYDLVLMDIQMPVLDGYGALNKALENGYTAPIVALTAHALKDEKEKCLEAGFRDYLSKPVNRVGLIQKISEIAGTATDS